MGWEERNGHYYYYKKKRIGDRVISDYIGSGEAGDLFAKLDFLDKRKKEQERIDFKQFIGSERIIDHQLDQVSSSIRNIIAVVLLASGHHTHKGQWRKTRNGEAKYC